MPNFGPSPGEPTITNANCGGAESCPRFVKCSAPICPLDAEWSERRHLSGERVCIYLIEAAKWGGVLPELHDVSPEQRQVIEDRYEPIRNHDGFASIRVTLQRSSKTPSTLGRKPGPRTPEEAAA